jgi:hypothetical protein
MGIQGTPGVTPIGVLGGLSSYRFPITGTGSALRFGGYGDPTGIGYAPGSVAFGTEGVAGGGHLYGPGATAAAPTARFRASRAVALIPSASLWLARTP